MKKAIITVFLILTILFTAGCGQSKDYSDFAKCLTSNNMTMYGAYWCPHCNAVKKEFGDAFKFISYVECDANGPMGDPDRCLKAGIEYYPSFIFGDGQKLFGEVSFEIMADKTGCKLPS
jgi:hypothetical protein